MLGYIFVENINRHTLCKLVMKKFKLLCLTYGMRYQVRYDKGLQLSEALKHFLNDIRVNLTPSSANNPSSNGLAKSAIKNAKLLLRNSIEEKSSYAEILCYFNQWPRADGQRVRSYLPTLDDKVDVEEDIVAIEMEDLLTKNATQTHNPLPPLKLDD